jgi:hypothetical protein
MTNPLTAVVAVTATTAKERGPTRIRDLEAGGTAIAAEAATARHQPADMTRVG